MGVNVVLVDLYDNALGELSKEQAHAKPSLHRAFSVFLYRKRQLLIQQRAFEKYHCGGLWANTCCSHPGIDDKVSDSAIKRLQEETGITHGGLEYLFAFTYIAYLGENLYEYEYDHIFLGEYDGEFYPDPTEIAQMRWVDIAWLEQDMIEHPLIYAPWFLICAPKVLKIISERTKDTAI